MWKESLIAGTLELVSCRPTHHSSSFLVDVDSKAVSNCSKCNQQYPDFHMIVIHS